MSRSLFFGWICWILSVTNALSASADAADLVRQLDAWDAAVAARDLNALAALAAEGYVYVEPDPQFVANAAADATDQTLQARLLDRVTRDIGWADVEPRVQIVGPTAIATGTYRLLKPELLTEGTPRLVAQGRFTTTWVRADGAWRLLAEHRSLNDVQAWAGSVADSPRQPAWARGPSQSRVTEQLVAAAGAPATAEEAGLSDHDIHQENESQRRHRGLLPETIRHLFRAYEPTQIGVTWDQGDDPFMDFTLSPLVALHGGAAEYPEDARQRTNQGFFRPLRLSSPNLYFAATLRAGQYINTRPSSPVVGKRFNPLLTLRLWGEDVRGARESMANFLEVVYGHESNGQFISSAQRFAEQLQVYRNQALDGNDADAIAIANSTALRSARDNISRGWDYVGVQFARDWDSHLPWSDLPVVMSLNAKLNYYLDDGLLQGAKEDYNDWENDPEGKPRNQTDGFSLRYTLLVDPWHERREPSFLEQLIRFERRYAFTWTTGYDQPFKFNTLKAEATVMLMDVVPLTVWYRYGYNSDLIDYYRRDRSFGFALSYWDF